jgi:hypothetical protein
MSKYTQIAFGTMAAVLMMFALMGWGQKIAEAGGFESGFARFFGHIVAVGCMITLLLLGCAYERRELAGQRDRIRV